MSNDYEIGMVGLGVMGTLWDRRYMDHVQIAVAERVGIEHPGESSNCAGKGWLF